MVGPVCIAVAGRVTGIRGNKEMSEIGTAIKNDVEQCFLESGSRCTSPSRIPGQSCAEN